MRFASASFTQEDDWFVARQVTTLGQLTDLRRGNVCRTFKVELFQCLERGETRLVNAPRDRPAIALFHFRLQQRFQVTEMPLLFFDRLSGQPCKLPAQCRQAQLLAVLLNDCFLQRCSHSAHWTTSITGQCDRSRS